MSHEIVTLIFAMRTRTVRGIRTDFPGMYSDCSCPMQGCSEPTDTLQHLLSCIGLKDVITEADIYITYMDVFSECLNKQKEVTVLFFPTITSQE